MAGVGGALAGEACVHTSPFATDIIFCPIHLRSQYGYVYQGLFCGLEAAIKVDTHLVIVASDSLLLITGLAALQCCAVLRYSYLWKRFHPCTLGRGVIPLNKNYSSEAGIMVRRTRLTKFAGQGPGSVSGVV